MKALCPNSILFKFEVITQKGSGVILISFWYKDWSGNYWLVFHSLFDWLYLSEKFEFLLTVKVMALIFGVQELPQDFPPLILKT